MRIRLRDAREWRRWFAWRPIITESDELVWLEWVERMQPMDGRIGFVWEYRTLEDAR